MKAKWFLLAGLSAMMLGACSSDDDLTNNPVDKPTIEGEAFMDLELNFPGTERTRGTNDQGFEPGSGAESKIKKISVYYFETTQGYKYLGKGTVDKFTSNPGDGDKTESIVTAKVPANVVSQLQEGETANIIVVLNEPDGFQNNLTNNDNYDKFNEALTTNQDHAGFMMTSVNYFSKEKETYFTPISKDHIYEEGAANKNFVEVWVERVCGKVDLTVETTLNETDEVKILGWNLNVRNKSVYPVKVLDASFTNLTATEWPGADDWTNDDAVTRHRSYWAKDTNYKDGDQYTPGSETDFTIIKAKDLNMKLNTSLYCLENTFDFSHQDRDETTTAVVLAQYLPKVLELKEADKTWVTMNGLSYDLKTFVSNYLKEQNAWKKTSNEGETPEKYEQIDCVDVLFTYEPQKIGELNVSINANTIKIAKKEIEIYKKVNNQATTYEQFTDDDWTNLTNGLKDLLSSPEVSVYVDGHCYYEIPIRHFKDNEVPLEPDWNGVYQKKHLGRYGIVRNHWYKLNIKAVTKPGKPIPGTEESITPDPDPDDPTMKYNITVEINILPWAVRNQDVEL